jgi:hypothetical protein
MRIRILNTAFISRGYLSCPGKHGVVSAHAGQHAGQLLREETLPFRVPAAAGKQLPTAGQQQLSIRHLQQLEQLGVPATVASPF